MENLEKVENYAPVTKFYNENPVVEIQHVEEILGLYSDPGFVHAISAPKK